MTASNFEMGIDNFIIVPFLGTGLPEEEEEEDAEEGGETEEEEREEKD